MPKTLVLSGFYGYDNAGDEAVLLSIVQQLKKAGIQPIILSGNPKKTRALYQVDAVHRFRPDQVVQAIQKSDGLISGGGSLLQDVTSVRNVFYYLGIIRLAQWLKKPVFCYAQGIGPLENQWIHPIICSVLERCTYVSVRDPDSLQLLKQMGLRRPVALTVDPVLGLALDEGMPDFLPPDLSAFLSSRPVAISMRHWKRNGLILQESVRLIDGLTERGIPVLLLPFHFPHDADLSRAIARNCAQPSLVFTQPSELPVQTLVKTVASCRLMIGMRLHALIMAASQCTPFLGISYDPKIDSFLDLYAKQAVCSADDMNGEDLLQHALRILSEEEAEQIRLAERLKLLEPRLHLPAAAIESSLRQKEVAHG